jgi:DNA-directed RNA polymerase specialized sigma24 family protein
MNCGEIEYTPAIVRRLLDKLHYFTKLKESGNEDAIVFLIDLKTAMSKSKLTDKQKEVFQYRYVWAYTVDETAKLLRVGGNTVIFHEKAIASKLSKILNDEVDE